MVSDTGIGIRPEDLQRVMALFGQAQSAYSRSHPGSGLGLPIARSLAEMHDGVLSIDSRPEHGTTVRVTFPPERLVPAAAAAGEALT
ncbi:MAG: ATP-binding protein [Magnetospirillum sp.]|nr:ATP-binding protein [Magnetospirillum sp.]